MVIDVDYDNLEQYLPEDELKEIIYLSNQEHPCGSYGYLLRIRASYRLVPNKDFAHQYSHEELEVIRKIYPERYREINDSLCTNDALYLFSKLMDRLESRA